MEQMALKEMTDKILIHAHCKGEKAAFEEIIRRYGDGVLGYLTKMSGNRSHADDLFQETFVRVHTKAHTFRGENLKPWIYTIATNTAINGFRKQSRQQALSLNRPIDCPDGEGCESAVAIEADESSEPSHQASIEERKGRVRHAIRQLPPRQRAAVILAYYQRLTYRQVAEVLGCSLGSVKTHMFRALKTLAKTLPDVSGDMI